MRLAHFFSTREPLTMRHRCYFLRTRTPGSCSPARSRGPRFMSIACALCSPPCPCSRGCCTLTSYAPKSSAREIRPPSSCRRRRRRLRRRRPRRRIIRPQRIMPSPSKLQIFHRVAAFSFVDSHRRVYIYIYIYIIYIYASQTFYAVSLRNVRKKRAKPWSAQ